MRAPSTPPQFGRRKNRTVRSHCTELLVVLSVKTPHVTKKRDTKSARLKHVWWVADTGVGKQGGATEQTKKKDETTGEAAAERSG